MSAGGGAAPALEGRRAVALGGGHGLAATLSALRRLTDEVIAVVTVADDGGSSGRIRRELDILPLGDLRMALGALAGQEPGADVDHVWRRTFEHRYGGTGALAGHAVGNLMLAGLLDVVGDPVSALDEAARLLGVRGRVLPMSTQPVDIEADVTGIRARSTTDKFGADVSHRIRGQVAVATTPGRVRQVRLDPRRPRACPEALEAIRRADVVTLGPGSWFTSVLPHLLVPELLTALCETEARRVLVLNLAPQPGETAGFSPEQHLDVLAEHAPRLRLDVVVADEVAVVEPDRLRRGAEGFGAELHLAAVGDPDGSPCHDPVTLADALVTAAGPASGLIGSPSATSSAAPSLHRVDPVSARPNGRDARQHSPLQHEEDHQWP